MRDEEERMRRLIHIETPRLILRDWEEKDLDEFKRMNGDETVMHYFPNTLSEAETIKFYQIILQEFQEWHYGLYAVELKADGQFIGFIGFHRATFEMDFTPCIEIGWRLKKEAWGKGYATEGAKACLEYGFNKLDFKEVYSFTAKVNKPSENVMKKIGMNYIKDFDHPRVDEDSILKEHVLYKIGPFI